MCGHANRFRICAAEQTSYAIGRYIYEVNRQFDVMNTQFTDYRFLAGPYLIADMASVGWAKGRKR